MPACETMTQPRPRRTLCPIWTRLSRREPAPITVSCRQPRSIVVLAPTSTSSSSMTRPSCGTLSEARRRRPRSRTPPGRCARRDRRRPGRRASAWLTAGLRADPAVRAQHHALADHRAGADAAARADLRAARRSPPAARSRPMGSTSRAGVDHGGSGARRGAPAARVEQRGDPRPGQHRAPRSRSRRCRRARCAPCRDARSPRRRASPPAPARICGCRGSSPGPARRSAAAPRRSASAGAPAPRRRPRGDGGQRVRPGPREEPRIARDAGGHRHRGSALVAAPSTAGPSAARPAPPRSARAGAAGTRRHDAPLARPAETPSGGIDHRRQHLVQLLRHLLGDVELGDVQRHLRRGAAPGSCRGSRATCWTTCAQRALDLRQRVLAGFLDDPVALGELRLRVGDAVLQLPLLRVRICSGVSLRGRWPAPAACRAGGLLLLRILVQLLPALADPLSTCLIRRSRRACTSGTRARRSTAAGRRHALRQAAALAAAAAAAPDLLRRRSGSGAPSAAGGGAAAAGAGAAARRPAAARAGARRRTGRPGPG